MADNDDKKDPASSAKPGFDPKPVRLGGESLLDRLVPHMKKIVIAIGIATAVLTVIFTIRHFKERAREGETEKLSVVIDVAARQVRPAGVDPDPKQKDPGFASNKERAAAVLDALTKQGTKAAGGAFRASLLVQAGQLDEAIAEYRNLQAAKGIDGVLGREGLGIAIETKALQAGDAAARQRGLEEALGVFQAMQPDEAGPRRAYALYHQGRILGQLGKNAEAKTALEAAKTLGTDADLPGLIEERLASLGAP